MSTLFFEKPLNKAPAVVTDGRYDTYHDNASLTMNIDSLGTGIGAARDFTHIFLVCEGVTSYGLSAYGGNVIGVNVSMRTYKTGANTDLKDSSGYDVNPVINGKTFDLYHWDGGNTKYNAKYLTFTFAGSNIKIYQCLVLNSIVEIADGGFSDVRFLQRLPFVEQVSARGRKSVAPLIAGQRAKWEVEVECLPEQSDRTDKVSRALFAFFAKYPQFVCSLDFSRYPDIVFEGKLTDPEIVAKYRSTWKALGRVPVFSMSEL